MTAGLTAAGVGEIVDRCLLVGFAETEPPDWLRRIAPAVGGVVLYGCNLRDDGDVARLAGVLRAEADVLIAVDEEGGDVTRMHYQGGSPAPGNLVLGRADDLALTGAVAAGIAARLRAADVGLNLAPDVDVNADPDNPVIGVRSFGADPALVSRHAVAWIEAMQRAGVAACAKHFPGHGDTRTDSHLALPVVGCDVETWWAVHAPPFAAAVDAGVRAVMTAHLRIPSLDDGPATMSRRILTDLLRGELGFDGVVVTDALDMGAITGGVGAGPAAVAALAAGADALCLGVTEPYDFYRMIKKAVVDAVLGGDLPLARVAEAAERVAALRAWIADRWAGAAVGAGADRDSGTEDPGLVAARRAVVAHRVTPLAGQPVVVELRSVPNLAVGNAAWDLAGPLTELGRAPIGTVRLAPGETDLGLMLELAGYTPLVIVGRDVARHAWQREVWDAVRAARPEAVLVDLGLPRPEALPDAPYVLVGGAALPNLRVAAETLVHGAGALVHGAGDPVPGAGTLDDHLDACNSPDQD